MTDQTERWGPYIRQLWLDALRSGQYSQGKGFLKRGEEGGPAKHCCFGVLAELCSDRNVGPRFERTETGVSAYVSSTTGFDNSSIPDAVHLELVGMHKTDNGKTAGEFMYWNDEGMPFEIIADRLETYFKSKDLELSEDRP